MSELRDQHKAFAEWFLQQNPVAPNAEDLAWAAWKAALAQPETEPEPVAWQVKKGDDMSTLREAAQAALEQWDKVSGVFRMTAETEALRAALAQPEATAADLRVYDAMAANYAHPPRDEWRPASDSPEVTVLPDGSAFGMMSFPLPYDHWMYRNREYLPGADDPVDLPKPILTHALCEHVEAAVRYAVRGATNCGKELDFDPDALVLNAVYALCGPYGGASLRDIEPPTEAPIAAKCQRIEGSGEICGLTPPCPDCGSSLIDVPEGSL